MGAAILLLNNGREFCVLETPLDLKDSGCEYHRPSHADIVHISGCDDPTRRIALRTELFNAVNTNDNFRWVSDVEDCNLMQFAPENYEQR